MYLEHGCSLAYRCPDCSGTGQVFECDDCEAHISAHAEIENRGLCDECRENERVLARALEAEIEDEMSNHAYRE